MKVGFSTFTYTEIRFLDIIMELDPRYLPGPTVSLVCEF